ncbi:MAG TPA: 16S rRNA (adenine(1518)-N(6)/adenine(1519)-N(6))-dimethyltransferase RsmA, partial [Verrucomicrobiae bacterium]
MTISEMRQILVERGIQLTKSLGQNFLHDQNILKKIVHTAELRKKDSVLEIGPGLGPLTELLLSQAGAVLAMEKDWRLIEVLRERFAPAQNLELMLVDALEFLKQNKRDWTNWKVVSNLPYSVASPILVELALADKPPALIVATLQLEVAKRLMAQAGSEDYGLLTLLVQSKFQPDGLFKIPVSCFFPAPDVDSACVKLRLHGTPLMNESERVVFDKVIRRGFS